MSVRDLKFSAVVSAIFGLVSCVWLLNYLALTDIRQGGEPNLGEEWIVVAVSFFPIILFPQSVPGPLISVFKFLRRKERGRARA